MKDCDVCENTGIMVGLCSNCAGSGEGMFDGSTCTVCKGSGSESGECTECERTLPGKEDWLCPNDFI